MTAGYNSGFAHSSYSPVTVDISKSGVDGMSSEPSGESPRNLYGYENACRESTNKLVQYPYPVQGLESTAAIGMMQVELDFEGSHITRDCQRKKNGHYKDRSPHLVSRRRAQNRASQKAFRERKERHIKKIEEGLADLQGRYNELVQSYETLQLEYSVVRQEMETLQSKYEKVSHTSSYSSIKKWDAPRTDLLNSVPFDFSAHSYELEVEGSWTDMRLPFEQDSHVLHRSRHEHEQEQVTGTTSSGPGITTSRCD